MATLILQVPDESLVSKVRQACANPKEYDVTKTAGFRNAMEDVKHGRVTTYNTLKDFYKEMGL